MDEIAAILYPSLLVCLFFGIIIGIGVVFSYWGLRIFDKQMRKCPRCQKVGTGQVTESEVIASKNHMDYKPHPPVRVTVKTYEEHYECEQCGHIWTRKTQETIRIPVKL